MKSKNKSIIILDSAVFQLTPTRTRCDLYIIYNDEGENKKEKIASGLVNPFIAHLKTAQLQIQQGGYSVFLQPPSPATWFTNSTLLSFVRFVSTPEILERVCTIESEILQIHQAISIQASSNNNLPSLIQDDQPVPTIPPPPPPASSSSSYDVHHDKAIVLYQPGAPETANTTSTQQNSKLQLLNVLETRKTVLNKEQGMAFARATAAGFDVHQVAHLLSFAECFGASRLMSACLKFTDLWKQKHESGQWVEIQPEAEDAAMSTKSDYSPSGIVLSTNRDDSISETIQTEPGNDPNAGGQQQYHTTGQFPHPGFPPWAMHSSPGGVPVYQPYPMHPYYQHYPAGSAPFYPPPPYPPYPTSSSSPMDNYNNSRYTNSESDETLEQHKNGSGKSDKRKSGRVVIRNINFINSKSQNSSLGDEDESVTDDETERQTQNPKRKGNRKESETEISNGKETDSGGHWDAFQSYLLKGAEEGDRSSANEDMFAMEKDPKTKRRQKTMSDNDPLAHAERGDDDGEGHRMDMQSYDRNGRKTMYRNGNDDFMIGGREEANVRNSLADNRFETSLDRNGLQHTTGDEAVMVSLRSTSVVNENRSSISMDFNYDLPSSGNKNSKNNEQVKYEPDALSLIPERDVEKKGPIGYDPALDYEMQIAEDAAAAREKKSKEVKKGGPKSAEKQQQTKVAKQGGTLDKKFVGKGRPSKVNNTLEDARARAEKLRSYKADLQKMKKQQQDAEHKRLEALKMERQKRIAARGNPGKQPVPTNKLSPMSHRNAGSKFTDSEPGSSSPLQRSKIRPASIGSISNSKKPSTSKLINGNGNGNHSAGNRLTRSLSSMSDSKKEINSVTPVSVTRIRRLSEPKKISNTRTTATATATKTQGSGPVSKSKLSNGSETKKISATINLDQSKAVTPPELKIKTSKLSSNLTSQKAKEDISVATSQVAKLSLNDTLLHTDDNPIIVDKTIVMLEDKQQQPSVNTKEVNSNHGTGVNIHVVDKETISVQTPITGEVSKDIVEENHGTGCSSEDYKAPYARVSSFEDPCTRNSEYAKAPNTNFGMVSGNERVYISDFNNLKLEKIPEMIEKPQAKGFRRLLKLGKKSHTPTDTASGNDTAPQVNTLKSLISEDETPSDGHTSQKSAARHFSILSSFRGKTTAEKARSK